MGTVKLAQKQSKGVPVYVNPVLMRPTGAESEQLGLKLRIGPDDVEVEKKKTDSSVVAQQLSQTTFKAKLKAWCACKEAVLAQKREEPAAAPEAGAAANATAGNGTNSTNATAPAKEVDLEALKCNRIKPEGKDLNCHLDGQNVTVAGPPPEKKNGTEGNATEGEAKEGEEKPAPPKEGEGKPAKEGEEGKEEPKGTPVPLGIKVTAPVVEEAANGTANATAPAEGKEAAASLI